MIRSRQHQGCLHQAMSDTRASSLRTATPHREKKKRRSSAEGGSGSGRRPSRSSHRKSSSRSSSASWSRLTLALIAITFVFGTLGIAAMHAAIRHSESWLTGHSIFSRRVGYSRAGAGSAERDGGISDRGVGGSDSGGDGIVTSGTSSIPMLW